MKSFEKKTGRPQRADAVLSGGIVYVLMCSAILLLDIFSGPYILLGITYVIPVALAAWYRGFRTAIVIAILLPLCRIPIAVGMEHIVPAPYAVLNAAIRICVLWLVAWLVCREKRHTTNLETEVKALEGILPICSHCKRIRDDNSKWQRLESYISTHSEAEFTHGICPDCARNVYGMSDDEIAEIRNAERKKK